MNNINDKDDFQQPKNIEEFKSWFKNKFHCDSDTYINYYDVATNALCNNFLTSSFWKDFQNELQNINDQYLMKKGYQLLSNTDAPEINIKSLNSLLIKAFRKNVINNDLFPNAPKTGWINQNNWFESINDILRTTIVVKYLDGVEYIINHLAIIAERNGCDFDYSYEAREEGYYAAHVGVKVELGLINESFISEQKKINIEIQITTELQEIIKTLLHKHYEENRKRLHPRKEMWQWDYHCDEFASNYLGHIVHYVEGMIVEIRDKQQNNK